MGSILYGLGAFILLDEPVVKSNLAQLMCSKPAHEVNYYEQVEPNLFKWLVCLADDELMGNLFASDT